MMKNINKKEILKGIGITCLLAFVIITLHTYGIGSCSGRSMYPTLEDGDYLLVNCRATPEDGDIIILDMSNMEGWNSSTTQIVKRYYAEYSTEGYYVIGDNTEHSYDSRYVGEVDKDRLIGVVACNLSQDDFFTVVTTVFEGLFSR